MGAFDPTMLLGGGILPLTAYRYMNNDSSPQASQSFSAYGGMPSYPAYNPAYNPNTMSLAPGIDQSLNNINPDSRGLNQFRSEALRSGPSAWGSLATAKSFTDEAHARDALNAQSASDVATSRGNLAMRGGLRSGASERIQTDADRHLMDQSQNIGAQGASNRQQIGINDEQNRITQLGLIPQMDQNNAEFGLKKLGMSGEAHQADIKNLLNENQNYNNYNMGAYQTQGNIWGANQQANATQNSGSGGSYLCTAAKKYGDPGHIWTADEWQALRDFRRYALKNHRTAARFYFDECEKLIARMVDSKRVNWPRMLGFVRSVIKLVEKKEMEKAMTVYSSRVRSLLLEFWPEARAPRCVYKMEVDHASR